jgi:hypothetical protein
VYADATPTYANTYSYSNSDANSHHYTYTYSNPHTDANSHGNTDAHTDAWPDHIDGLRTQGTRQAHGGSHLERSDLGQH